MAGDLEVTSQRLNLLVEVASGSVLQAGNGESTSDMLGRTVVVTREIALMEQAGWVQLAEARFGARRWDLTDTGRQVLAAEPAEVRESRLRRALFTMWPYYVCIVAIIWLSVTWRRTGWGWAFDAAEVLGALYLVAFAGQCCYAVAAMRRLRVPRRPQRHQPTQGCMPIHCHSCNLDEPGRRDSYITCGECGHVYRTAGALRRQWRRVEWEWMRNPNANATWFPSDWSAGRFWMVWSIVTMRVANIYSCPLCDHDF